MARVSAAETPGERLRVIAAWSHTTYERGAADLEGVVFSATDADPRVEELAQFLRAALSGCPGPGGSRGRRCPATTRHGSRRHRRLHLCSLVSPGIPPAGKRKRLGPREVHRMVYSYGREALPRRDAQAVTSSGSDMARGPDCSSPLSSRGPVGKPVT